MQLQVRQTLYLRTLRYEPLAQGAAEFNEAVTTVAMPK